MLEELDHTSVPEANNNPVRWGCAAFMILLGLAALVAAIGWAVGA